MAQSIRGLPHLGGRRVEPSSVGQQPANARERRFARPLLKRAVAIRVSLTVRGRVTVQGWSRRGFRYRFTTAGNFKYHCAVHPFMHGEIIVEGS